MVLQAKPGCESAACGRARGRETTVAPPTLQRAASTDAPAVKKGMPDHAHPLLRARTPVHRTSQRWCIAPALLRDPSFPEPFESAAILDEVGGELGLLLWHTSRDVLLWAAAGPEQREHLFAPGSLAVQDTLIASATDSRLHQAIHHLTGLLRSSEDEGLEVTERCEAVSEWAVDSGLERTAIAFAVAAAAVNPADPARYVRAGRLMARYHRRTAAETWLRRGISLARRAKTWKSYAEAWLELGRLDELRGDMEAAGRGFKRAAAVSRRKGLRSVRAHAYHGLLRAAAMLGEYEAAKRHADKALRLFADHREHTHVVHDLAAMMLREDPQANARECSSMLRTIVPLRRCGVDRISSLTLLVRAAGYARDAGVLSDAWFDAVRAIERLDDSREAARLLLDLARAGSEAPGIDAVRVADIARRAFNMAARVGDRSIAQEADSFRQELWRLQGEDEVHTDRGEAERVIPVAPSHKCPVQHAAADAGQ